MFVRELKYTLLILLRSRENIFWTFLFPFALGTFMYLALGNIYETTEKFETIPVAVVSEQENTLWQTMLEAVSGEESPLLKLSYVSEAEAEAMLAEEEITGIFTVDSSIALKVKENGMKQTILQMIVRQMLRYQTLFGDVGKENPERIADVADSIRQETDYFVEENNASGNQDNTVNYFYAIFAMTCLFASFVGCEEILTLQANMSSLGQRRSIAGTNKVTLLLADFLACEVTQYVIVCLLFLYMDRVLGIQLGDKYGAILLLLLIGTSWGIMFGILVGMIPRLGEGGKISLLVSVNLFFCAMSDLMIQGVKDLIEHHIPIVNRINPAALFTDSFYALNLYDTYDRFVGNIMILLGMIVAFVLVCYLIIRRNRYASL